MKKCLLLFAGVCISFSLLAQVDSTTPPFKKFPTVPPLQILLGDSTTYFKKQDLAGNKPTLIMLFSPDCSHCQHEAEAFMRYKNDMKGLQIVMITFNPLHQMNDFVNQYQLKSLPNVVVGRDAFFVLPSFYAVRNLPFHALYNKKGKLITTFEGSVEVPKLLEAFKN